MYQSISFARALQSDVWTAADDEKREMHSNATEFEPDKISRFIDMFIRHDAIIRSLLSEAGTPSLYVSHEEIDNDYEAVWEEVREFLNSPEVDFEAVIPKFERLRDATSDQMAEDYIRYIRGD